MKTYKIDPKAKGWMGISGDTAFVVAHYKDGHTETMELFEYLAYPRKRRSVIQIDCYTEEEKHLLGL